MNALELRKLTKSFGTFTLGPLDLTLPSGCIMGLVGQNGAGKSTTIRLILDILHKDGGEIRLLGQDHRNNLPLTKEYVGVVPDTVGLPGSLTAKQIGSVMRRTFRTWNPAAYRDYLDKLSLPDDLAFEKFSLGMTKKLGIAIAMSHDTRLLILDEATSGLDPVVREQILELLMDFTRDETHSVLLSSHIVSDLEKVCDYVAFLHNGQLMLCEEKDRLLEEYALVHCSAEELARIPKGAVRYKKESVYGAKAIVLRSLAPADLRLTPVTLEELFIFMAKEAN